LAEGGACSGRNLNSPPPSLTWGITTDADIEIVQSNHARLTQDGKVLDVHLLTPDGSFSTKDAPKVDPPHASNGGVRRLEASFEVSEVTIAVLFAPQWPDGSTQTAGIIPTSSW